MEKYNYNTYADYVAAQTARSHTSDDQRCRFINGLTMKMYKRVFGRTPGMLLDIGCRDACWFDDFQKDGTKCVGVEISKVSAEYAQSKGRDVSCEDINTTIKTDFTNTKPDMFWMIHSLEHVLDPVATMDWIARNLAPNGHVVIKQPANQGKADLGGKSGHVTAWNQTEILQLFAKNFDVVFYTPLNQEWFFVLQHKGGPLPAVNVPQIDIDWWFKVPSTEWQLKYNALMQDDFIREKVGRKHRLDEKKWYVDRWFKKLRDGGKKVLDIGCGPSEFLEVARHHFNDVQGIDTPPGKSLMGDKYWAYSVLTHERQLIDVVHSDIYQCLKTGGLPFADNEFYWVNSQGALNQIFAPHLKWHDREGGNGTWIIDEKLKKVMYFFLCELKRITAPGGLILLYPNGSQNNQEYSDLMKWAGDKAGLVLENHELKLVHQFKVV